MSTEQAATIRALAREHGAVQAKVISHRRNSETIVERVLCYVPKWERRSVAALREAARAAGWLTYRSSSKSTANVCIAIHGPS